MEGWDHLFCVAEMLFSSPDLNLTVQSTSFPGVEDGAVIGMKHLSMMAKLKSICTEPEKQARLDLSILLDLCSCFQSTDPRDKIFALLGLLTPENSTFCPDYSKSTTLVYTETAQSLISQHCNEIFSFVGIGYRRDISNSRHGFPIGAL